MTTRIIRSMKQEPSAQAREAANEYLDNYIATSDKTPIINRLAPIIQAAIDKALAAQDAEIKRLQKLFEDWQRLAGLAQSESIRIRNEADGYYAQLAAAKEALQEVLDHDTVPSTGESVVWIGDGTMLRIKQALSAPSPIADQLREDKARLDWLEKNFSFRGTQTDTPNDIRAEIDAAIDCAKGAKGDK